MRRRPPNSQLPLLAELSRRRLTQNDPKQTVANGWFAVLSAQLRDQL